MLYGLIKPTMGNISILGEDIKTNTEKFRINTGYMAQKFLLYGSLTIRQNLEFFTLAHVIKTDERENKIDEIINQFGLKNFENEKTDELPFGIKQRLSLGSAIIHNPSVLFLDEPISGVDVLTKRDFKNHIKTLAKKGITIIISA